MLPYKTLVFPTDFSTGSDQALEYALLLARHFDAELHVLNVSALAREDSDPDGDSMPEERAFLSRLEDLALSKIDALLERWDLGDLEVRPAWRGARSASDAILGYAAEVDADAIVMGTQGRRGPSRWLLGSVAEAVLRGASCPVMVVRERGGDRTSGTIQSVVVPIDFSASSGATLSAARELAEALGAGLDLLHVVDLPTPPTLYGLPLAEIDIGKIEAAAMAELRAFAEQAGLSPDDAQCVIDNGSPAAAIVDHAALRDCGLIVMPAKSSRRPGLLGSTTDGVVRRATCPVLTLPMPESS